MKKLIVMVAFLLVAGCMPASQQEVLNLTEVVNQIVPAVREAVSASSEDTKEKVEVVLGQVEEINEAVATAKDPVEAIETGWNATKEWNPYYGWGALAIALLKMRKDNKEKKGLEKGINRVKGEAEPELAKKIHDTMKIYAG